jgi:hypothetical protein
MTGYTPCNEYGRSLQLTNFFLIVSGTDEHQKEERGGG